MTKRKALQGIKKAFATGTVADTEKAHEACVAAGCDPGKVAQAVGQGIDEGRRN